MLYETNHLFNRISGSHVVGIRLRKSGNKNFSGAEWESDSCANNCPNNHTDFNTYANLNSYPDTDRCAHPNQYSDANTDPNKHTVSNANSGANSISYAKRCGEYGDSAGVAGGRNYGNANSNANSNANPDPDSNSGFAKKR